MNNAEAERQVLGVTLMEKSATWISEFWVSSL